MRMILQAAAFAMLAVPITAQASVFDFTLSGPGVSGNLSIIYEVNANAGTLPGTSPNPVDPVGSYVITGITGSFSNARLSITNAAVTGLVPVNFATPDEGNKRAPNSFSRLLIANGVQSDVPGAPPAPGLSYDNLFYPDGSPQTSTDYPFSGGLFDIYGVTFTIANGYAVNLWSNGVQPGIGLNYGVAVTDRIDLLNYTSRVSVAAVPEPTTWILMFGGFALIAAAMRRRQAPVTYRYC
ncbi:PEPxxWA-CTERM sorting domain-containing protein [Sphingomonas sp. KR1UV-12]|uniref:PEPxxWA-CTERM sorting domain-containing protein n=1 Tax=Sphingomonas aurea TaxID=3063994 RepID=A0ABT9EJG2_9SPHN|nr:PEPxxWA-CTERM sorting domain-containing protein [Sphingomonas sp. KR1UV-12]MDP1026975.1 PEPxxWA-CTERM sorting domain-containing protein [Sphingomonas sp. KR1UV-12]